MSGSSVLSKVSRNSKTKSIPMNKREHKRARSEQKNENGQDSDSGIGYGDSVESRSRISSDKSKSMPSVQSFVSKKSQAKIKN